MIDHFEKAIDEYISKFTPQQIAQMKQTIKKQLDEESRTWFDFGPKNDKIKVTFHYDSPSRELCLITGKEEKWPLDKKVACALCKWNTGTGYHSSKWIDPILRDMLGMVALWDITMKNLMIADGKYEGLDM